MALASRRVALVSGVEQHGVASRRVSVASAWRRVAWRRWRGIVTSSASRPGVAERRVAWQHAA
ncbi:hypothetical protein ACXZ9C_11495 [Streptococcus agalactiae]